MPGLVPGIHVFVEANAEDVDGRDKRAFTPIFDGLCPALTSLICLPKNYTALFSFGARSVFSQEKPPSLSG